MPDIRYPVGQFTLPDSTTAPERVAWIKEIARAPHDLRAAVSGLSEEQLDTPYRPGGWTARQVIHHVPESHMNAFIRFKLALTEDNPTVKPYNEDAWAKLPDVPRVPIATSLTLLDALHERWVALLEVMTAEDFTRPLLHPEQGPVTLDRFLQIYSWHGRHHTAHLDRIRA